MLQIRRYLISAGYNILYPCPLPLECPMWNSQTDWCHQFIQVRQDEEVERLSQMAHKDRKLLPLTVHAFSKSYIRVNPQERIVRVLPETKFSYEWEVCNSNKLDTYQVMKRGMDKATQKIYDNVLAGAAVESEVEKVLEKSKRVRISKFF